ncbi:metal-sulfur cluster assembly factor [Leekyejoonella antrihumi]|uniref:Metal-sulfur cluster assembly factor n=1 Tax=Leekyejoonella antrihumi TaxID=1660198 RepID=A0A563E098_9MICO|nr:metal-sulfur cluster assembly factor [Leekyejoonella antrihumi]TWP35815.1 metal-sulfur cluster assembly factor [Leekyejoonella antrihumi]
MSEPSNAGTTAPVTDELGGPALDLLHEVIDPEVGVNIVDLGLVFRVQVLDGVAHVRMTLTTPGCPLGDYIDDEIRRTLTSLPNIEDTYMDLVWEPRWSPELMTWEGKRQLGWVQ